MPTYRMELLDHGGNKWAEEFLICDDDGQAVAKAKEADIVKIGIGYNVWHEDRLVHEHRRTRR